MILCPLQSLLVRSALVLFALFPVSRAQVDIQVNVSTQLGPPPSPSQVASAWYAGYHATAEFPLSKVPWYKYTQLIYSFAETTPQVWKLTLNGSDAQLLPEFVETAHFHGVRALIAVGGWSGSRWFSSDLRSAENRTAFVNTIAEFTTKYRLDGVNFDWEYPGQQGIGCNTISNRDTVHFLSFLQELRRNPIGARLILTAAAGLSPFIGHDGAPITNVTGFSEVLDYITVMNYDVWGSWSATVGPDTPLNDTCAAAANQQGSAVYAVQAWTAAGMPAHQIVLGAAMYGHSFNVTPADAFVHNSTTTLKAYPKFNATGQPKGDAWDSAAGVDECGVMEGVGGIFQFWGLIAGGFLARNGNVAKGIDYRWDDCSQTPYVYNKTSHVMVSFDNAKSFAAKGAYIKSAGLRGFALWEAGGDSDDILLDAIRKSIF
ncbi:glycoside hydrolase family 18 protein [Plicaturopsis crispa FD-325 SS-3]|nr:glycoside hydrolase family 18 protein [Plicaturopsis crispa FD-325 SS-3]